MVDTALRGSTAGAIGHLQAIDAVPVRPPYYSLLVAADVIEDGQRWQQGVEWNPEQVYAVDGSLADCFGSVSLTDFPNLLNNGAEPFVVQASDQCSTFGWQARDYEGRARRQLAAVRSAYIAKNFQVNTVGSSVNAPLESASVIVGPAADPIAALAEMEGAMADTYGGRRGMIHVTPQVFTILKAGYAIEFVGNKWQTGLGTIVVTDAGYAPISGVTWMYGTLMVQVRLGEVLLVPGSLEQARAQATDRATNLTTIYATQLALIQYDSDSQAEGDLVHKVEVDITEFTAAVSEPKPREKEVKPHGRSSG